MAAQRPSLYSKAKGVCVVWGAKVSSRALPENTLVVLALPRQKQLRAKTKPRPEIFQHKGQHVQEQKNYR